MPKSKLELYILKYFLPSGVEKGYVPTSAHLSVFQSLYCKLSYLFLYLNHSSVLSLYWKYCLYCIAVNLFLVIFYPWVDLYAKLIC